MKQYKLKLWYPTLPKDWGTEHDYVHHPYGDVMQNITNKTRMPMRADELHLDFWEEVKQPLFVTDDGVELFDEADKLFIVNKECYKKESKISNIYDKTNRKDFKYFFHEPNADEYIWRNKLVFSYEDFIRWGNVPYQRVIEQLAKERIEQ